ncbi:hypothetical protein ACRARG_04485 [Pseudooceanicola sp. C21-150M6]|uniref:hypothetical protein n=1 Tax=Pseudooceanicola sp. C21-150M6 TaxID=3434355 RepID=UPI003D7FD24F
MEPSIISPVVDMLLGQGLSGLVILWLGWDNYRKSQRIDALTDKLYEVSMAVKDAMNDLKNSVDRR